MYYNKTATVLNEDINNLDYNSLIKQIDVLLGGRVVEELFFSDNKITTGCYSDLINATKMAYSYILGTNNYNKNYDQLSEDLKYKIDSEVNKLLSSRFDFVWKYLKNNEKHIKILSEELISRETLTLSDIKEIIKINS